MRIKNILILYLIGFSDNAHTWSSTELLIFEPVHQMAIDNVLSNKIDLPKESIIKLKRMQEISDQTRNQTKEKSFIHAMTGTETPPPKPEEIIAFIRISNDYVTEHIRKSRELFKTDKTRAMEHLGMAIHTLEDSSSPVHERFQAWTGRESLIQQARHISQERYYPVLSNQKRKLECSVLWAYEIFKGLKPLDSKFFDDKNGDLLLPDDYSSCVAQ